MEENAKQNNLLQSFMKHLRIMLQGWGMLIVEIHKGDFQPRKKTSKFVNKFLSYILKESW